MKINAEDIRRHYASIPDEELLALDRAELTEMAQTCYDAEMARRGLTAEGGEEELPGEEGEFEIPQGDEPEPNWLEDAACACSFLSYPGHQTHDQAEEAADALEAAGMTCHVVAQEMDPKEGYPPPAYDYRVMVPGGMSLLATAILDQKVFNPKLEEEWRSHFETLSDEELRAINPDAICAGLRDRIARLQQVYKEERSKRAT